MSLALTPLRDAPEPRYPSAKVGRARHGRTLRRILAAAGASVVMSVASIASAEHAPLPRGGPPPAEYEVRTPGDIAVPEPPPPPKPPPVVYTVPPPPPCPVVVVPPPPPPPKPIPVRLPGRRAPVRLPGEAPAVR